MRTSMRIVLACAGVLVLASTASAQNWGRGRYPSSGACFYRDINYGGDYFCTRVGDSNPRVASRVNDEISSIRLFGNAQIIIYRDPNMRGEARRLVSSIRDLRSLGFNDRLSSYVVQPRNYGGGYGGAYAAAAATGAVDTAAAMGAATGGRMGAARTGAARTTARRAGGPTVRPRTWCASPTAASSVASPIRPPAPGSTRS